MGGVVFSVVNVSVVLNLVFLMMIRCEEKTAFQRRVRLVVEVVGLAPAYNSQWNCIDISGEHV